MNKDIMATVALGFGLASLAFTGAANGQEAPYLVGNYSANVERVLRLQDQVRDTAEPTTSSTFGFPQVTLGVSRPVITREELMHGNYSANIRMHDVQGN